MLVGRRPPRVARRSSSSGVTYRLTMAITRVCSTCTIWSRVSGPVPNERPGAWDGTGNRDVERCIEVDSDSETTDVAWDYVCADDQNAAKTYELLKQLGYVDLFDT